MPSVMALLLLKIMQINKALQKYGQLLKVPDLIIHEKNMIITTANTDFPTVLESSTSFLYWILKKPLLDTEHARKKEVYRFVLGSSLHVRERQEQKKFLEENMASAKVQAEQSFRIRAPFAIYVPWERAESTDCAPAKPPPVKRRCFQTFKKEHHEKQSFITRRER